LGLNISLRGLFLFFPDIDLASPAITAQKVAVVRAVAPFGELATF